MPTAKRRVFLAVVLLLPWLALAVAASWYGLWTLERYSKLDVRYAGDNEIVFDRELGFSRPPNATTRRIEPGIEYTIHTDSIGARVNARSKATPAKVDIVTVGDSFSEGFGMENEDSYTERLGRMLGVPVANFALGSYSAVQAMLSVKKHLALSPRVIVFGIIEDDLRRSLLPCAPNFFPVCLEVPVVRGLEDGRPSIAPIASTDLTGTQLSIEIMDPSRNQGFFARVGLGLRLAYHQLLGATRLRAEPRVTAEMKAKVGLFVLKETVELARKVNATVVLMNIGRLDGTDPAVSSKGWYPLPDEFVAGLPPEVVFVDASEAVKRFYATHKAERLYLTESNEHPNSKAHELFAQVLRDRIVAAGLLPR